MEILIVLNLDLQPREEFITVDAALNPEGSVMTDLLDPGRQVQVKNRNGRHFVGIPVKGHNMMILKHS